MKHNEKIRGAKEELEFWQTFIYSPQFATWLNKGEPAPELDKRVVKVIQDKGGRVLDVGSGVVSILYGVTDELTSCDLLAADYMMFFDYAGKGIKPPLPMPVEDLPFSEDFEVVHMRNALDHCQHPSLAWDLLKRACVNKGVLIVAGFENEGTHLRQLGMHQWDLFLTGQVLTLRNVQTQVEETLFPVPFRVLVSDTQELEDGRRWITWIGQKEKYA